LYIPDFTKEFYLSVYNGNVARERIIKASGIITIINLKHMGIT
jgi:hypothetical protein